VFSNVLIVQDLHSFALLMRLAKCTTVIV